MIFSRLLLNLALATLLIACEAAEVRSEAAGSPKAAQQAATPASSPKEDQAEGLQALREQCPDMDEATIKGILKPASSNRPDYDYYARSYCVSHDEASRRLALQGEWSSGETGQMVQEVITKIQKNESSTFAGHWIQHTPDYGMAVAFTKNAKSTLAKYTDNPMFIPVEIQGTDKRTIERNMYAVMAMLEKLDIPYSSANRDYKTNRFVVQLSVDKESYFVIKPLAAPLIYLVG